MNAAALLRGGCAVTVSPARDVPSWRVKLRRWRRAKSYRRSLVLAIQEMHERGLDSAFIEGVARIKSGEYARARRATIRQGRAFNRLIEALRSQERAR